MKRRRIEDGELKTANETRRFKPRLHRQNPDGARVEESDQTVNGRRRMEDGEWKTANGIRVYTDKTRLRGLKNNIGGGMEDGGLNRVYTDKTRMVRGLKNNIGGGN